MHFAMHSIHRGTLYYERGFEIVDASGWMQLEEQSGCTFVVIFGDPGVPVWRQRHTAVPMHRVVDADIEEVIRSSGSVPQPREALRRGLAA